ncbi:MAG: C40 family peptidase [Spirochaetes bacterium]|nr:C40 family peptidase [Spirochaetota bacterium]MBN2772551.1 C40 family peptidase [Spirochaetota bacterium]
MQLHICRKIHIPKLLGLILLLITSMLFSSLYGFDSEDLDDSPLCSQSDNEPEIPAKQRELREKLVAEAIKYLGKPYRYGGTGPDNFDCSGFTRFIYNKYGINLPRSSKEQYEKGGKISVKNILPGDLIFFHGRRRNVISHVAMYIGDGRFIHSPSRGKRVSISTIKDEEYWGKRYAGAATFIGIE